MDLLVQIAPDVYGPFVVFENGKKVLYVEVLRALNGMLTRGVYLMFQDFLYELVTKSLDVFCHLEMTWDVIS